MDSAVLVKLFGREQFWQGPCIVILDADAAIQAVGGDSIAGAGAKVYAPRMISGRINADAVCLLQDGSALLIVQQQKTRQSSGEEIVRTTLTVADPTHVVAVEFPNTSLATQFGIPLPGLRSGSHPGTQKRPPVT